MNRGLIRLVVVAVIVLGAGAVFLLVRSDDRRPSPAAAGAAPAGLSVSTEGWATDFSRHSVPLGEFSSGGPPRDGIPPIDEPRFAPASDARGVDREPVIAVEVDGSARAYPIRILIWHEIVNDTISGTPIAATFCPLCNTSIVFDRRFEGRELRFGTTGNLRLSDLVMWDSETESWWQQFSGEAVVGELTGARLERIPSRIVSLGEFRRLHPQGEVLTERTGHDRPYGRNPYAGYDDIDSPPFLLRGRDLDGRLPPKERVVSIEQGPSLVAVPFSALAKTRIVETAVGPTPVSVWWAPGVASALDSDVIADGRDVGSVVVHDRRVGGRVLTFSPEGSGARDDQTGSTWTRDGVARSGPLAGARLRPVQHDTPFWFAVAAFRPTARIVPAGG